MFGSFAIIEERRKVDEIFESLKFDGKNESNGE